MMHRPLHSHFPLREKDTPPGMEAVDRVRNKRSRMRVFFRVCPHPSPRQPLPATAPCVALSPHIHVGRRRCSTSCIHAVVQEAEGELEIPRLRPAGFAFFSVSFVVNVVSIEEGFAQ